LARDQGTLSKQDFGISAATMLDAAEGLATADPETEET
jgi:hypothetical protein